MWGLFNTVYGCMTPIILDVILLRFLATSKCVFETKKDMGSPSGIVGVPTSVE